MKPLSELLAEVEPQLHDCCAENGQHVLTAADYNDYQKLKAVAVELANKIEESATLFQTNWTCGTCVEVNNDCYKPLVESLTTARAMLGD